MTSQGDKQSTLGRMGMEMETAYDDDSAGNSADLPKRTADSA